MWASGVKAVGGGTVTFESRVRATLSGNQVVTTATWTEVEFDTTVYDGLDEHDNANDRIVINADGYYSIKHNIMMSNVGLDKPWQTRLKINGTVHSSCVAGYGDVLYSYSKLSGSVDVQLSAGDLITVEVHHQKGADRSVISVADGGSTLCVKRFA